MGMIEKYIDHTRKRQITTAILVASFIQLFLVPVFGWSRSFATWSLPFINAPVTYLIGALAGVCAYWIWKKYL